MESWNVIHYKSSPKNDPPNFCGITLNNFLRKPFSIHLHSNIENEVDKSLSQSQTGFRENQRTTDKTMTLFTLIKKSLREETYLCTCFLLLEKHMTQYADRG